jgi:Holliday junction resolvase RusA-like endonuclease
VLKVKLVLLGRVPSKKNEWKRASGGGIYFAKDSTRADIDSLIIQARSQWRGKPPARKPTVLVTFHMANAAADLDNRYSTISDVLVKAGVLVDDCLREVSRFGVQGVVDREEKTVIELIEAA